MSIIIIECCKQWIIARTLIKQGTQFIVDNEKKKLLEDPENNPTPINWIEKSIPAIKKLLNEIQSNAPIILLLSEFCLIKNNIFPRVTPKKQSKIIHTHIQLYDKTEDYLLTYDITKKTQFEIEVLYCLIKQSWIETFCKDLHFISHKIIAIKPSLSYSLNLIPPKFKKHWLFNRYRKTLAFILSCLLTIFLIITQSIHIQINHYKQQINSITQLIHPLQNDLLKINHNEKIVENYNQGFNWLQHKNTQQPWLLFLNSLQDALLNSNVHLYSMKILKQDLKEKTKIDTKKITPRNTPTILQIKGTLSPETQFSNDEAINAIKQLMKKITKVIYVEDAKNLFFDTSNLSKITFSFSLILNSEFLL